jgi:hypothetical protein
MNTIIKKVTALLLTITLCVLNVLSQTNEETVRIKIGGISINSENHQVLDTCQIGVYYNYTYPQKSESIIEKSSDTLFLAIGNNVSVFLDPLYKEKLEIPENKSAVSICQCFCRLGMIHCKKGNRIILCTPTPSNPSVYDTRNFLINLHAMSGELILTF